MDIILIVLRVVTQDVMQMELYVVVRIVVHVPHVQPVLDGRFMNVDGHTTIAVVPHVVVLMTVLVLHVLIPVVTRHVTEPILAPLNHARLVFVVVTLEDM